MLNLKFYREALGITQAEAARRIGISRQRYNHYETGIRGVQFCDYETLLKMSEVFGVSVDALLDKKSTPAEIRRSAVIERIMSLPDDQLLALAEALEALGDPVSEEPRTAPESK